MLAGIIAVMARIGSVADFGRGGHGAGVLDLHPHFGGRIERASRRYHENESVLLSTVQESLSSMRALQAFTREPDTSLRFGAQAGESFSIQLRLIGSQLLFSGRIGVALSAGTAFPCGSARTECSPDAVRRRRTGVSRVSRHALSAAERDQPERVGDPIDSRPARPRIRGARRLAGNRRSARGVPLPRVRRDRVP